MNKAIVLAYHDMGCAGLAALLRHGFEVQAVFTYPDAPDENIWFDSVAELAARHGIPTHTPDDINHPLWIAEIAALAPDFLFSFYYRHLVGEPVLAIPSRGCLNLHGSLLPAYRGRAPVNWVLVNGETQTGVTLHHMTPRPDDGDIVCQSAIGIADEDTAVTLNRKLVEAASAMLDDELPRLLDGSATRTPQDARLASYFGGRKPDDGLIDWRQSAAQIRNLVRAVTRPYPGAFTYRGSDKMLVWEARSVDTPTAAAPPGKVLDVDPLLIACGSGVLRIDYGQLAGGILRSGADLARELRLAPGSQLSAPPATPADRSRKTRVLILGINGFIGNALTERLLASGRYEVHGMDLNSDAVQRFVDVPDFFFHEGDICINREWVEYHVKKCDVIVPLVAIATPIEYTRNPIKVFELDFEENLRIVRHCVKYRKRVVFPSTSEVYGMCNEDTFDEDNSRLVQGPINRQRWIYSCSKQLLDRVIWAYGQSEGLRFTLFRPFNWLGPRLDSLDSARIGSSRAITQLILNLVEGTPMLLVDGGEQKRCFTDVSEGIECLFRIIENAGGACDGQIINIGNPDNEASIRQLSTMLLEAFEAHPLRKLFPPVAGTQTVESHRYYGDGYEDVQHRRPSIRNATKLLGWTPVIPVRESVRNTLDYFLREYVADRTAEPVDGQESGAAAARAATRESA